MNLSRLNRQVVAAYFRKIDSLSGEELLEFIDRHQPVFPGEMKEGSTTRQVLSYAMYRLDLLTR